TGWSLLFWRIQPLAKRPPPSTPTCSKPSSSTRAGAVAPRTGGGFARGGRGSVLAPGSAPWTRATSGGAEPGSRRRAGASKAVAVPTHSSTGTTILKTETLDTNLTAPSRTGGHTSRPDDRSDADPLAYHQPASGVRRRPQAPRKEHA